MDSSQVEPLSADERAELEYLRRRLAEQEADETSGAPVAARRGLRWTATGLLLVLVAVLAFSAVLARYARSEVLDTDRYVATMTPLVDDQIIQDEVTAQITEVIMVRADIAAVTREALTRLTENAPNVPPAAVGLAPVLSRQAEAFIEQTVRAFVGSDQFEALWLEANRRAHAALVGILTGEERGAVSVDEDGTVELSLAPVVEEVRDRLLERGFAFADNIPEVDASVVLFEAPGLVKAQRLVAALDKASTLLPWLTLLVAALAVWVAPTGSRRRALSLVGVAIAVAMALLAVALGIGRALYLDAVPPDAVSPAAAAVLIDTLLVPLRGTLRAVAVVAIVIALAGYLSGSSGSAVAIRRAFRSGIGSIRGSGGRLPHGFESAAARYRVPLRIAIVAVAILVLVFWDYPSGVVVLVTVLVAAIALFALQLVANPALEYRSAEVESAATEEAEAASETDGGMP